MMPQLQQWIVSQIEVLSHSGEFLRRPLNNQFTQNVTPWENNKKQEQSMRGNDPSKYSSLINMKLIRPSITVSKFQSLRDFIQMSPKSLIIDTSNDLVQIKIVNTEFKGWTPMQTHVSTIHSIQATKHPSKNLSARTIFSGWICKWVTSYSLGSLANDKNMFCLSSWTFCPVHSALSKSCKIIEWCHQLDQAQRKQMKIL